MIDYTNHENIEILLRQIHKNDTFITVRPKHKRPKHKSMKQQLINWLFPPVPETEPLEYEHISNKRFILMVSVTIASMIIAKLVTKL